MTNDLQGPTESSPSSSAAFVSAKSAVPSEELRCAGPAASAGGGTPQPPATPDPNMSETEGAKGPATKQFEILEPNACD